jgi:hypothetical protein
MGGTCCSGSFTHSTPGRLVWGSGALYFVGGGVAALLGSGTAGMWVFVTTALLAVVGTLAGCVFASEPHPVHVLGVILIAPIQAWVTLPAMMLARKSAPGYGWLFVVIGVVLLVAPFVIPAGKGSAAATSAPAH